MAKNKESPEHGALSKPVKRPNSPTVKVSRHSRQAKNHSHIPHNITHRLPRILNPTMLWNCCPNITQIKRRSCTRVKLPTINPIFPKSHHIQWSTHIEFPTLPSKPIWHPQRRTKALAFELQWPNGFWGEAISGLRVDSRERLEATFWDDPTRHWRDRERHPDAASP